MRDPAVVAIAILPAMVAGWFAHAALASSPPPATPATHETGWRPTSPSIVQCDGITADEVRELLASRPDSAPAKAVPAVVHDEPPPSPESVDRLASIQAAISDGVWTADDRELFHHAMNELTRDQRETVLSTLVLAINSGRLRLDAPVF